MGSRKTIGSDFTKRTIETYGWDDPAGRPELNKVWNFELWVAAAETWARDLLLAVGYCAKDLVHDKQLQVIEQKTAPDSDEDSAVRTLRHIAMIRSAIQRASRPRRRQQQPSEAGWLSARRWLVSGSARRLRFTM
jgi:hypothetical protein